MYKRVLGLVAAATLFTYPVAAAQPGQSPVGESQMTLQVGGRAFSQADIQNTVQTAYRKLGSYIQASGATVGFSLSDFRTLSLEEGRRISYLELISAPDQARVQVVPLLLSGRPGREREVYQATLVRPDRATAESWGRRIQGKTFGELLAIAARDEKQLRNAQAITSYRVHRIFGETSIEYRAAVVWLTDPQSRQFEAYIVDHLTEGVDRALGDNYRPGLGRDGVKVHPKRGLVGKDAVIDGAPGAASCVPSSTQFSASYPAQSGAEEHNSGAHTMTIQDTFTCTCDASCNASCSQSPYFSCSDNEDISGLNSYHQASSNVALDQTSTSDGLNVAPYCVIGYACAVRSCLSAYFCSLSVTVGWSGSGVNAGVTFTTTSDTIWSRSAKLSHTCSKCTAATPPPPPAGGGSPDDGSGNACYAGEIVTPLECVNDCNGVISGGYCYI